jgi:phosphate transport system permease protein
MSTAVKESPVPEVNIPELEKSLRSPRTLFSSTMSVLTAVMTGVAVVPLFCVLYMLISEGIVHFNLALFTELPPAARMPGGGVGNALVGTLVMIGIAALISVPFGILAAVFLSEFSHPAQEPRPLPAALRAGGCLLAVVIGIAVYFAMGNRDRFTAFTAFLGGALTIALLLVPLLLSGPKIAEGVRFAAKVLTGLPSILAGVFAYELVVRLTDSFSAVAGGVALAVLMLPTVLLTAEEAIRMVPGKMREAAIGMGATPTQVVWHITLPTAMPGILTGVMLAVARAAGETAPLLFTALFSNYWMSSLGEATPSLAVLIYNFSSKPFPNQIAMAWAASLLLVLIVLALNITGQVLAGRSRR